MKPWALFKEPRATSVGGFAIRRDVGCPGGRLGFTLKTLRRSAATAVIYPTLQFCQSLRYSGASPYKSHTSKKMPQPALQITRGKCEREIIFIKSDTMSKVVVHQHVWLEKSLFPPTGYLRDPSIEVIYL